MTSFEERLAECRKNKVPMAAFFHDGQKCCLTGLPCVQETTTTRELSARINALEYTVHKEGDCRLCAFALAFINNPKVFQ